MAKYVKVEKVNNSNVVTDIVFTTKDGYESAPDDTLMFMEKANDGTFSKGQIFNTEFFKSNPRERYYPGINDFLGIYVDGIVKANTAQQQEYIDKCDWVKKCIPLQGIKETLTEEE